MKKRIAGLVLDERLETEPVYLDAIPAVFTIKETTYDDETLAHILLHTHAHRLQSESDRTSCDISVLLFLLLNFNFQCIIRFTHIVRIAFEFSMQSDS